MRMKRDRKVMDGWRRIGIKVQQPVNTGQKYKYIQGTGAGKRMATGKEG
jgi:hypothetical protein